MKGPPARSLAVSLAAGLLLASPARADAGVPMLVLIWPAFWLLLAPIVLVEASVASRQLGLPRKSALAASLAANAVSTLAGVPVTWGILAALEMVVTGGGSAFGLSTLYTRVFAVTAQAPWLIPYEHDLYWMIPTAAAVLLVPFFFMSVFVEGLVMRRFFKGDRDSVKRWSRNANAITYAGMMVITVGWAIVAGIRGK